MISERKAARLAQRAARPGWRGERAADRLRDAVVGGDLVAARSLSEQGDLLDGAWRPVVPDVALQQFYACRYHYRPNGRHPFSLLVWRPEAEVLTDAMRPGVVVAAAAEHPVAEIARAKILANLTDDLVAEVCEVAELHLGIAAFAEENGLVPADPVRRARYLLTTGRLDAYRAVDPDGELFAAAYAAASAAEKTRLRERALRLGHIDTVRLLVGRNRAEEVARLRDDDVSSLGRAFAAAADWPGLWRLAKDASVVAAASMVSMLDQDWSPETRPERRLLDALRSVTEAELIAVRDTPTLVHRVDVPGTVIDMSVAPDASELAASWTVFSESGSPLRLETGVFDLTTGEPRHDLGSSHMRPMVYVAHCGEAGLVTGSGDGLVRSVGDRTEVLCDRPVSGLASAAGNFAAWTPGGVLLGVGERGRLVEVPAATLALGSTEAGGTGLRTAASADGSRFAFAGYDGFVVFGAAGDVLTRSDRLDHFEDLTFLGPAELVTSQRWLMTGPGTHTVRRWRVGEPIPVECAVAGTRYADNLVGLLGLRRVVTGGGGQLYVLDGESLQHPDDWPRPLNSRPVHTMSRAGDSAFASATFRTALGGYADAVEVHDLRRQPLRRLLDRPVAAMRPADFDVAAALAVSFDDPVVRAVHAALAARFGREVSLGAVRARADDIAIAGDDGGGAT